MAITTQDGIIAGLQPGQVFQKTATTPEAIAVPHSLFYSNGFPGAATAPSPGVNGAALTTYAGQIPFNNPGSGNTYLAGIDCTSSQLGTLIVADRLWHNSGLTVTTTTAQSITHPGLPARDASGSSNGVGVMLGIEVSTATTNAGAVTNMTASYTDSDGTSGQTATISSTRPGGGFPATAVAGTFIPFELAAGDTGVRSVESVTFGTSLGGGAVHLVQYREIARIPMMLANAPVLLDALACRFPRLYDNTVPFLFFIPSAASGFTLSGSLAYAQG